MDSKPTSVPFDTALARELTTFEDSPHLVSALKWRLLRACEEIDYLRTDGLVASSRACAGRGRSEALTPLLRDDHAMPTSSQGPSE